jgi:C-5 cytosine-specific DNA methylase
VLENVRNILSVKHRLVWSVILRGLWLAGSTSDVPIYKVFDKILNTVDYGVPQCRRRVYIVMLRKDVICQRFAWPVPTPLQPSSRFLDDHVDSGAARAALPAGRLLALQRQEAAILRAGGDLDQDWIVDIYASPKFTQKPKLGIAPCLTKARGGTRGFWITSRRRMTNVSELLRLQGLLLINKHSPQAFVLCAALRLPARLREARWSDRPSYRRGSGQCLEPECGLCSAEVSFDGNQTWLMLLCLYNDRAVLRPIR